MSRLDDLIHKLCPNGVRYYTVDELIKNKIIVLISPIYKIKQKEYLEIGSTPIISQEAEYVSGYTNLKDPRLPNDEYVCFGDHTEHLKYVDFEFVQGADGLKVMHIENKEVLNTKYYYYVCSSYYLRKNTYERHFKHLRKCLLPLPPLEVQKEIVRLLDDFTAKTAELQAELNKEYEARKKQYEYYRDNLLLHNSHSKEVKLGEVATIGDGLHSTPKYDDNGSYYFINGNNIKNGALYLTSNTKRCSESEYSKHKKYIPKSTVMMSINGTIGSVGIYNNEPIILGKSIAYFITTEQLSDKFLYHYLQTSKSSTYFRNHVTGSTIKNLGLKALRDFQIYLPPIIDQKSIIQKLDEYESMSKGLQSKISSEIESRQKQYEYYRDKLLTFNKLGTL